MGSSLHQRKTHEIKTNDDQKYVEIEMKQPVIHLPNTIQHDINDAGFFPHEQGRESYTSGDLPSSWLGLRTPTGDQPTLYGQYRSEELHRYDFLSSRSIFLLVLVNINSPLNTSPLNTTTPHILSKQDSPVLRNTSVIYLYNPRTKNTSA